MLQTSPRTNAQHRCSQCETGPRTILLVEDEQFLREVTQAILESAGFAVLLAEDAPAAIKAYEASERPIDLVMTDMVLPGRSGDQLGQELRQRAPQLKVLVTSGYSDAESETENPASQTYFLAKPYSRNELVGKIEAILEPQSLRRVAASAS